MEFLTQNWTEIGVVLLSTFVIGERLAAWTENKTDDKIFAAIHGVLKFLKIKFPEAK